jgi:methionyl-tRNA formyltransferase
VSDLRVGFAGTPPFAATALAAILEAGFSVPVVLTQPDRPRGRGLALAPSPVKQCALAHAIPCLQPPELKTEAARNPVLAIAADVLVVAAYGLILPPAVLAWPRYGCLNIHASRLPRWRGAAPIQRAIATGDTMTAITIMQMDAGLDTGPMLEVVAVPIAPRETTGTLHDKLAVAGAQAIVSTLRRLDRERALTSAPQPTTGVTYANKVGRADAALDWTRPAEELDRVIRAMDPAPGAFTRLGTQEVKIWAAIPAAAPAAATAPNAAAPYAAPGTVLALDRDGIHVACGQGVLRLTCVQPAAGKRMAAMAYAAGRALSVGTCFGTASEA